MRCRRRPSDPWFDAECRAAKRLTRRLERIARQANTSNAASAAVATAEWRAQRRVYRDLRNRKRESFWQDKVESESSCPQRLWKSIDALLGRGHVPPSRDIGAETFHQFFEAKVAGVRASTSDAPSPSFTPVPSGIQLSDFRSLTVNDVTRVIHQLPDKQCESDPLPTRLLKECCDILAPFIAELVNRSLSTGSVPAIFKAAYVTPLLKKPDLDPAETHSYRPISNLSVLSKLLERLVAQQLLSYLNGAKLLPKLQSAYRAHHSTETAVVKVLTDILCALDCGDLAMLTLLDLSAAFDTVDHTTLLRRLEKSYGLHGRVLRWFASYIEGRTQFVRCGSGRSTPLILRCGVPQGSVLGPILFLLYTADLISLIESHKLFPHLYADDTQILGFCSPSCTDSLQDVMSVCIDEVSLWMRSNRLQMNTIKTDILWCATSRRQHQIPQTPTRVGYDYVTTARSVRDLGIYLDSDVTMTTHVTKTASSCFAALRQIRAIRRSVTRPVLLSLVVSLVLSRLDYGNATLAGLPDYMFDKLQSVLNAAARLIFSTRRYESVTPLLRDLHWLRVPQRVEYKLAVLVYRCLHDLAPAYLSDVIRRVADISSRRRLRSSSTSALVVPAMRRSTVGDRAFHVAASRVWNRLPPHTTSAPSLQTFKKRLKSFLFGRSFSS